MLDISQAIAKESHRYAKVHPDGCAVTPEIKIKYGNVVVLKVVLLGSSNVGVAVTAVCCPILSALPMPSPLDSAQTDSGARVLATRVQHIYFLVAVARPQAIPVAFVD